VTQFEYIQGAEGQREIQESHIDFLEEKFLEDPHVDLSTFGVWTLQTPDELKTMAAKRFPKMKSEHDQMQKLLNAEEKNGKPIIQKFVYGGQHGSKCIQRCVARESEPILAIAMKMKTTTAYGKLDREEKIHLCLQHNEVQQMHKKMTDFERSVITLYPHLCIRLITSIRTFYMI
jgi:hypothetical protein